MDALNRGVEDKAVNGCWCRISGFGGFRRWFVVAVEKRKRRKEGKKSLRVIIMLVGWLNEMMGVDECRWMEIWRWMEMDGDEWRWMEMNGDGWR